MYALPLVLWSLLTSKRGWVKVWVCIDRHPIFASLRGVQNGKVTMETPVSENTAHSVLNCVLRKQGWKTGLLVIAVVTSNRWHIDNPETTGAKKFVDIRVVAGLSQGSLPSITWFVIARLRVVG